MVILCTYIAKLIYEHTYLTTPCHITKSEKVTEALEQSEIKLRKKSYILKTLAPIELAKLVAKEYRFVSNSHPDVYFFHEIVDPASV